MSWDDVLDVFFNTIEDIVESITLPTGDSLVPTFIYSVVITVASLVSRVLFKFSFLDWRGAAIATVLLLGLAIIERRGINEVSRLCRAVKSGTTTLKEWSKGSGPSVKVTRGTNPGDEMQEEVDGPTSSAGPV